MNLLIPGRDLGNQDQLNEILGRSPSNLDPKSGSQFRGSQQSQVEIKSIQNTCSSPNISHTPPSTSQTSQISNTISKILYTEGIYKGEREHF